MSRMKKCKVCGKEYQYCNTPAGSTFRWQDVACCPEHAGIYFTQIKISRNESVSDEEFKALNAYLGTEDEPEDTAEELFDVYTDDDTDDDDDWYDEEEEDDEEEEEDDEEFDEEDFE